MKVLLAQSEIITAVGNDKIYKNMNMKFSFNRKRSIRYFKEINFIINKNKHIHLYIFIFFLFIPTHVIDKRQIGI